MKRNQVNAILVDQAKRAKTILLYLCVIIMVFSVSLLSLLVYFEQNKNYYVNYSENGIIDYKVYIKENDFFNNNYLEKNNQYIASLIDYITAEFKYNLSMDEENVNYTYSYRIDAIVDVKEKGTQNSLYNFVETILETNENNSNSNEKVSIQESIQIDYNKYNNLIKKFISVYELDDIESVLTINMYVKAKGSCEEFREDSNNESIMSLSIPLTTRTMAIDISNNMVNANDNILVCKKNYTNVYMFLIISIAAILCDVILIVFLLKYQFKTRTAETIYEKELKKILNNYRSYIHKINNIFDLKGYQSLIVDTFNELLEIRDTIQQPILMVENESKNGVYFIIPSNTKLLYMYRLKVSDIKKQMQQNTEKIDV